MDVDLTPIAALLPWLALASPVMGLVMSWVRKNTILDGLGLISATTGVATVIVGALGLALGWDLAQWRGAPLGLIMLSSGTIAADTMATHVAAKVEEKKGAP